MKNLVLLSLVLSLHASAQAKEMIQRLVRSDENIAIAPYASPCEVMAHKDTPENLHLVSHFGLQVGEQRLAANAYFEFESPSEEGLMVCKAYEELAPLFLAKSEVAPPAERGRTPRDPSDEIRRSVWRIFRAESHWRKTFAPIAIFMTYRGQVLSHDAADVSDAQRTCHVWDLEFYTDGTLANSWIKDLVSCSGETGVILHHVRLKKRSVPCTAPYRIVSEN